MAALPPTWQTRAASKDGDGGGTLGVSVLASSPGPLAAKPLLVTKTCQLVSRPSVCVCLRV